MAEKILIISPVPLFPSHAGNRRRILNICTELIKRGYELDFFYTGYHKELNPEHDEFFNGRVLSHMIEEGKVRFRRHPVLRMKEIINGLHIKAGRVIRRHKYGQESALYNKSLYDFKNLKKLSLLKKQLNSRTYKSVILNYAVYSFYLDLFDKQTIKIIDTHDRLSDRYKLYLNDGQKPAAWKSITQSDERKAIRKADVVWAITKEEADFFSKLVQNETAKIVTVPHLITFNKLPAKKKSASSTILTVGGKGLINITGLNWFFENVWRQINEQIPDVKLLVAGSICDVKDQLNPAENVTYYGRYSDPREVYNYSDFCLNPIQFGTGLKIKTLEGLSFGKTVLTTETGGAGLKEFAGKGLIIKNTPQEWINFITNYFHNPEPDVTWKQELGKEIEKMHSLTLKQIFESVENSHHENR
jgi:polysaccharide biosynthesis protein PslH